MKKLLFISVLAIGNFVAFASFPIISNQENFINQGECDNIILKDGEEISAKILEVTPDLIKYKKCDNLDGPSFSIYKSEVLMIKYSNGTTDKFIYKRELEGVNLLGIFAFVSSFIGIFYAPLIFGLVGIILGGAALQQKNKSKAFGIAGILLGLLLITIAIIIAREG